MNVIATKYFVQYIFAASGSAGIIPLLNAVGVGLATTIGDFDPPPPTCHNSSHLAGTVFSLFAGIIVMVLASYGERFDKYT